MFQGRSKFETNVGLDLHKRLVKFEYEAKQYEYKCKPYNATCSNCGSKEVWEKRKYTPDFFLPNGIIIEAKGRWIAKERKILLAIKEDYPELDIRMLFQYNNWLTKKHTQRYGDWCDKRDIKWSVGYVPEEWTSA